MQNIGTAAQGALTTTTRGGGSLTAWPPAWVLGRMLPGEGTLPAPTVAERDALIEADRALEPIDRPDLLAALVATLEIYGVPANWPKISWAYAEALADMPPDIVADALRDVRFNLKWFPKPCELRAACRELYDLRIQAREDLRRDVLQMARQRKMRAEFDEGEAARRADLKAADPAENVNQEETK